jgi:hypothetical protein
MIGKLTCITRFSFTTCNSGETLRKTNILVKLIFVNKKLILPGVPASPRLPGRPGLPGGPG